MTIRKCESCEKEVFWHGRRQRVVVLRGWTGVLKSRFGGNAWWCPGCQYQKDMAILRYNRMEISRD